MAPAIRVRPGIKYLWNVSYAQDKQTGSLILAAQLPVGNKRLWGHVANRSTNTIVNNGDIIYAHPIFGTTGLAAVFLLAGCADPSAVELDFQTGKINITSETTFGKYIEEPGDPFEIDSVAIDKHILSVYVSYGGGCEKHEFTLIGSDQIAMSYPPQMFTTLIHNANGDTCEAYLKEQLQLDLSAIAELMGDDFGTLIIHVNKAPQQVMYDGSVSTSNDG